MVKRKNLFLMLSVVFAFVFVLFLGGCSSEASVEQLQKIKELEAEKASLEKSISSKESEKATLEAEVKDLNGKLQNCNQEKETVKQRLSTWQEPAPVVEPAPTDKKSTKKKSK
ncbi:MAG TPA: hypothetical protein PKW14_05345 [Bacteroidota bacterium]|jgi:uncharacterized protein YlxW (UPF0749 family)|nr:hypothetical protein [Bacteroidota bacterium]